MTLPDDRAAEDRAHGNADGMPHPEWSARAIWWGWAIVAVGIGLRVLRYADNRSLWLDEAFLAESILTYTSRQLATTELLNWQAAPVGFLLLEKLAVSIFGGGEYALRLVPLLAGVASVPLFHLAVRRSLPAAGGLVALAMFATVEPLVYYSAEVKQYGVDAAVAVLILWLTLPVRERPESSGRLAALALSGAAALFLSHPSVFVLAASGLVLLAGRMRRGRWGEVLKLGTIGGIWLALFAVNYFVFLRPLTKHPGLDAYWSGGYMPLDPTAIPWLLRAIRGLFDDYGTMWLPLPAFAIVAAALGIAWLWVRRDRGVLALLTLPVMFALIAAALHRFPFSGRLVLFLVPGVILLVACGAQAVFDAARPVRSRRLVIVTARTFVTLLVGPSAGRALFYAVVPPGREEMKSVLAYVRDHRQPGDAIYVFHLSDVPFRYYRDRFGLGSDRFGLSDVEVVPGRKVESSMSGLGDELARRRNRGRVWVVLTHTAALGGPDETVIVPRILDGWGRRVDEHMAKGAVVLLYEMGEESHPRTRDATDSESLQ